MTDSRKQTLTKALLLAAILTGGLSSPVLRGQDEGYVAPPVELSTEKVKFGGKYYLSHIVKERQTLYSIAKAYDVTVEDIYDANPSLRESGLQKNAIILIPIREGEKNDPVTGKYIEHKVGLFDTIDKIAERYGVTPEQIMSWNSLPSRRLTWGQTLKIHTGASAVTSTRQDFPSEEGETEEPYTITFHPADTSGATIVAPPVRIVYTPRNNVSMALVLPFHSTGSPSESNMDFYSGVLMAIRDLSKEGIRTKLDVYDLDAGLPTEDELTSCDFVLGPVATRDLETVLARVEGKVPVISPLEQKAQSLSRSSANFIQVPPPVSNQYEALASWIAAEKAPADRVILINEASADSTAAAMGIREALSKHGVSYRQLRYSLSQGRNIQQNLTDLMTQDGVNRIITATEREPFAGDLVRNLGIMLGKGYKTDLYATSRMRSFDTVEGNGLHNLQLHICPTYYVDYGSEAVKTFVREYRAMFCGEPSQFSFQGYDTAKYFLRMSAGYGYFWPTALDMDTARGLHMDFRFVGTAAPDSNPLEANWTNTAVRKVLYKEDFTSELIK